MEREVATKAIFAESTQLLSDGTWGWFNQFCFNFGSQERLRVLDARRHGSAISGELLAVAGADGSDRRKEFSAKWWRVRTALDNQARAVQAGTVNAREVLEGNVGAFGEGDAPLPDHPTAVFDRFMSDLKAIGLCSPAMDEFRQQVRVISKHKG